MIFQIQYLRAFSKIPDRCSLSVLSQSSLTAYESARYYIWRGGAIAKSCNGGFHLAFTHYPFI